MTPGALLTTVSAGVAGAWPGDEVAAVILERAAVEGLGVREAAVYREVELACRVGCEIEVLCCGEDSLAALIRDAPVSPFVA